MWGAVAAVCGSADWTRNSAQVHLYAKTSHVTLATPLPHRSTNSNCSTSGHQLQLQLQAPSPPQHSNPLHATHMRRHHRRMAITSNREEIPNHTEKKNDYESKQQVVMFKITKQRKRAAMKSGDLETGTWCSETWSLVSGVPSGPHHRRVGTPLH
ncbi:GM24495 [Drosophila sechellia]|uniref:GM24495 n=1 Tax=Drosophila sechellia TaxID=7238 RepID=B4HI67_DROSE|nr:GM24495 [Drosophila sechellia]